MNKHTRRSLLVMLFVTVTIVVPVSAQSRGGSAEVQAAREELNSILDLGRFLGFIHTMSTEQTQLRLNDTQVDELLTILRTISRTSRLTGSIAESHMARIEDDVLTARQLVFTDQLWIASERERANSSATPSATAQQRGAGRTPGDGSGTPAPDSSDRTEPAGELAAFAAGGDFNPLVDTERPQGESFQALLRYLETRAGGGR